MAQLESAATSGISSSQQQQQLQQQQQQTVASPLPHPSLGMDGRNLPQPVLANQGKQATIHDFLSLCGTGASSTSAVTVSNNGSQQSVTTQDLLQPLQKSLNPGSSSSLLNGFVISAPKPYDPSVGQQNNYAFGNGSFELRDNFQSNYRSANISFAAKGHVPHAIPLTKHWQQQQQQQQEASDGNKRLARIPSEEDDDEDDESFDHGYSARKEGRYQKCEQQLEGRNADSKGATPRSKHSATEQRRRSKINDRFQMLRQLLPNADQKRDKASFLLEVIEHIQMLHEKVKKYEGPEHRVPHQERTNVLSWDRNSGQQDLTYVSTHDTKEAPDMNGYMRSRLSPLRVISEDGIANSELMCSVVHASTLQGAQVCLSNNESKPLISKPIPLNFSQPPATSTLEQAPNPAYQTEGQIMFGQLLRQEEQAAIKARGLVSNKPEVIMPHFQQSRNMLISQESSQVAEHNFQRLSRNNEQNLAILNFRRLEDEVEGRAKVSQLTDISATSKESGKYVKRPAYGFDGKTVNGVMDGSKAEQRSEVSTNDQEANPAVLGGMINISSVYSQGLLDTLTRALQSSGVDLTQATISVQIDLGKPEGSTAPSSNQMASLHTGALPFQNKETVSSQDAEHSQKRLKIEAD